MNKLEKLILETYNEISEVKKPKDLPPAFKAAIEKRFGPMHEKDFFTDDFTRYMKFDGKNKETGSVSHKVIPIPSFEKMYDDFQDIVDDIKVLMRDKDVRADKAARELFEIIRTNFRKLQRYLRTERPDQYALIRNRAALAELHEMFVSHASLIKEEKNSLNEIDTSLDPYEDRKEITRQVIELIKRSMPADNEQIKAFIKTHYDDIINLGDDEAILDEFQEFLSVNYPPASDFIDKKRPSGSDLLDLRILIQQVVGVKTLEDALEVIKRYESKDFKGRPVSPEEAKELIAGLRAKEEDKDDRKITDLMAKAFSIKLNEGNILNESLLDEIEEEEPTPEEEPNTDAPAETVLEDATDQILGKFPTVKAAIIKLQTEDYKEFVESVDWISPRPSSFRVNLKNGQEYILKWTGKTFEAQILGKKYLLSNIAEYQQALDKLAILYKEAPMTGAGEGEPADTDTGGGGGGGEFPGDDAAGGGEEGGEDLGADDAGGEEGGADLGGEEIDFEEPAEEPEV